MAKKYFTDRSRIMNHTFLLKLKTDKSLNKNGCPIAVSSEQSIVRINTETRLNMQAWI